MKDDIEQKYWTRFARGQTPSKQRIQDYIIFRSDFAKELIFASLFDGRSPESGFYTFEDGCLY